MATERRIHFLHIGKNAGTAIGSLLLQINAANAGVRIAKHSHKVKLRDLPPGEDYMFAIRAPETRFKSGFYSRKRRGQPRIRVEWSAHEATAFAAFEHANDLAEALFREDERGHQATMAITSIGHCSAPQIAWFERCAYRLQSHPPLAILRQSRLESDCRALLAVLGIDVDFALPDTPVEKHANDYRDVPELSARALENLRSWYSQDYAFVRMCEDLIESRTPNRGETVSR